MSNEKLICSRFISNNNSNLEIAYSSVILDIECIMHEILSKYSCERYYRHARDPTFGVNANRKYRKLLYGDNDGSLCVARMEFEFIRVRNQERSAEGLRDELNVLKQQLETLFNKIRKEKKDEKNSKGLGNRWIPVLGKRQNPASE